jgi:hypothetical protein
MAVKLTLTLKLMLAIVALSPIARTELPVYGSKTSTAPRLLASTVMVALAVAVRTPLDERPVLPPPPPGQPAPVQAGVAPEQGAAVHWVPGEMEKVRPGPRPHPDGMV